VTSLIPELVLSWRALILNSSETVSPQLVCSCFFPQICSLSICPGFTGFSWNIIQSRILTSHGAIGLLRICWHILDMPDGGRRSSGISLVIWPPAGGVFDVRKMTIDDRTIFDFFLFFYVHLIIRHIHGIFGQSP
jgi:hypothetical protein